MNSKSNLEITEQSDYIKEIIELLSDEADEKGLPSQQVSAILGTVKWSEYLKTEEKEVSFYKQLSVTSEDKTLSANARKGTGIEQDIIKDLLIKFSLGLLNPSEFCELKPNELKEIYPNLSISKIILLQRFIHRELQFSDIDFEKLNSYFPLEVTGDNFFGNYINNIAETPQIGERHLKSATPFFVNINLLLMGLKSTRKNFIEIPELTKGSDYWNTQDDEGELVLGNFEKSELLTLLINLIDNASSIYQDSEEMKCIKLPSFGFMYKRGLDISHIPLKEKNKLSLEIMNWIIFGDKDGELINTSALSIENKKRLQHLTKHETALKKKIKIAETQLNTSYEKSSECKEGEKKALQNKSKTLAKNLAALEDNLRVTKLQLIELKKRKTQVKPIIKQLRGVRQIKKIIKFREQLLAAIDKKQKVVFTSFNDYVHDDDLFVKFFDKAFQYSQRKESKCGEILHNCSIIMSSDFASILNKNHAGGASINKSHCRSLSLPLHLFNDSAKNVIEGVASKKKQSNKIDLLLDFIVYHMHSVGTESKSQLKYLVSEFSGTKNPQIDNYLEYIFNSTLDISEDTIEQLFEVLHTLNFSKIPQICIDRAISRFNISPKTFKNFESYSKSYNPKIVGGLPGVFKDLASLDDYYNLGMDTLGMDTEIKKLESFLDSKDPIVSLIDSTEYHADLKDFHDETWGDYTQPSDRIIKGLIKKLLNETVLNHYLMLQL